MNRKGKKSRNAAESVSPELKALLAATRPVEDLDLKGMEEAARELDRNPKHVAETRKASVVEDILRALEEDEISRSELARRLDKSRQQLSYMLNEEKLNNFTIETMAEIATALDRHLLVRILNRDEQMDIRPITVKQINLSKNFLSIGNYSRQTMNLDERVVSKKRPEIAA